MGASMRYEFIEDDSINKGAENQSKLSSVGRSLGGGIIRGLKGLESLGRPSRESVQEAVNKLESYTGAKPVPQPTNTNNTSEVLMNNFGVTEEDLKSKGLGEEFIQRLISAAPYALAGGPAGSLGRTAIGAGTGAAAQQLTGSETLGNIAQGIGEIGPSLIKNKLYPGGLRASKRESYKAAERALAPGEVAIAKPLGNAIKTLDHAIEHKIADSSTKTALRDIRDSLGKNSETGVVDIENLLELKRSINANRGKLSDAGKKYSDIATKAIKNTFEDHGPTNPEFWKNQERADALHSLEYMQSSIMDYFNNDKNLQLIKKLGKIPIAGKGAAAGLDFLGSVLLGKPEVLYKKIQASPHFREHFSKAFKSVFEDNAAMAVKYLGRIENDLSKDGSQEGRYVFIEG